MLTAPQLSKRLTSTVGFLGSDRNWLEKEGEIYQHSSIDIVWRGLLDFEAI